MKTISYIDRVHKWGKAWNLSMLGIMLMFPIAVGLSSGLFRILKVYSLA